MDRTEPSLIPEWLKTSGSATNGGNGNHQLGYCLHSGDHSPSKHARKKSSFANGDHGSARTSVSERSASFYFGRSASGKDSSHSRTYGSFSRSRRDREWEDMQNFRDTDRSILGDHRHCEYSDSVGGVLLGKFSKETLRRSQSMVSRKAEQTLVNKVAGDAKSSNNNHIKTSSVSLASGRIPSSMQSSFSRDFPSLGADQKQSSSELRRVSSPILASSVHNLPSDVPNVFGADGWTSSLAEVPGLITSSRTAGLPSQQAVSVSSAPMVQRTGGLNMAEAVAQGPSRAQTPLQASVDTQRLEELAIKRSRQLIPVMPLAPKPTLLSSLDKSRPQSGPQLASVMPSHGIQSLRVGPVRFDSGKISSNLGKLQMLKPAQELNGVSSTVVKEILSRKNGVKVVNTSVSLNTIAAAASAPSRIPANTQVSVGPERKPVEISTNLDKRPPCIHTQSRNDFFNLLKKKSSSSASNASVWNVAVASALDKSPDSDAEDDVAAATGGADSVTSENILDDFMKLQTENGGGILVDGGGEEGINYFVGNGEDQSDIGVPYFNEEEAAFLRSLGWEENAGEDEGLTQDEIHAFYEYTKMKPRSTPPVGLQLRVNNSNGP